MLALAAFLGYTSFKATTGPPFLPKYQLTVKVPPDAPPMRKGQAVRVGGSLAGLIQSVEPDPKNHRTLIKVNISKTKFRPLPVDTTAFVRVHSIVYATYLSLQPGTSTKDLKDGDTVPAMAGSGTDLLEVVQLFDRQAREDLSQTLINIGFGAAGRGKELNGALRDLPETARDADAELRALTSTPGALSATISGASRTARGLRGEGGDDVAGLIDAGDATLGATASKSGQLGRSIELLRPFEDQVLATGRVAGPTLREIAGTAEVLGPAVRNLRRQLPRLNELARLGPELRNGFGALLGGGASGSAGGGAGGGVGTGTGSGGVANQVLIAARPVVSGLFPIQTSLKPLNAALAKLLATVNPYLPEITQAGQWLQSATSLRVAARAQAGRPGRPPRRGPHRARLPQRRARPGPGPERPRHGGRLPVTLATRRLAGLGLIVLIALAVVLGVLKPNPFKEKYSYWAVFDTAQGLGAIDRDVRIAGVKVGEIGDVKRTGDNVRVELELTQDYPLHTDATADMRPHTLFEGSNFVDLSPGSPGAPKLEDGATIPLAQTTNYVTLDRALRVLRPEIRGNLRSLAEVGSRSLQGRAIERHPVDAQEPAGDERVARPGGARRPGPAPARARARHPRAGGDRRRGRQPARPADPACAAAEPDGRGAHGRRRRAAGRGAAGAAADAAGAARRGAVARGDDLAPRLALLPARCEHPAGAEPGAARDHDGAHAGDAGAAAGHAGRPRRAAGRAAAGQRQGRAGDDVRGPGRAADDVPRDAGDAEREDRGWAPRRAPCSWWPAPSRAAPGRWAATRPDRRTPARPGTPCGPTSTSTRPRWPASRHCWAAAAGYRCCERA